MTPGVVGDLMSLGHDAARDLGIGLDVAADDVKRRADSLMAEDIKKAGRELRMRPVIECEGHYRTRGVDGIVAGGNTRGT